MAPLPAVWFTRFLSWLSPPAPHLCVCSSPVITGTCLPSCLCLYLPVCPTSPLPVTHMNICPQLLRASLSSHSVNVCLCLYFPKCDSLWPPAWPASIPCLQAVKFKWRKALPCFVVFVLCFYQASAVEHIPFCFVCSVSHSVSY